MEKTNKPHKHYIFTKFCPIGLTHYDIMTSSSHVTADWFSPVSVANELAAQHLNT